MLFKSRLSLLAAFSLWAVPTFAADSTVTAMPAAGALTGPELFYCIQGGVDSKCTATQVQTFAGPAGANLTLQYNNAGVLGGMSGTSWDDTNRSLTITGATVTLAKPVIDASQIWNGGAANFVGIRLSVTNTASGAGSNLMELNLGGSAKFLVNKTGAVSSASTILGTSFFVGAIDVILSKRAAANLRLGADDAASPVAQTLSVQGSLGTNIAAPAAWTLIGPLATGNAAPGDIVMQTGVVGASGATASVPTTAMTIKGSTQHVEVSQTIKTKCYTIAAGANQLPAAGTSGRRACVTDQLTACPVLSGTFTAGGNVICGAFDNGTAWVHE